MLNNSDILVLNSNMQSAPFASSSIDIDILIFNQQFHQFCIIPMNSQHQRTPMVQSTLIDIHRFLLQVKLDDSPMITKDSEMKSIPSIITLLIYQVTIIVPDQFLYFLQFAILSSSKQIVYFLLVFIIVRFIHIWSYWFLLIHIVFTQNFA